MQKLVFIHTVPALTERFRRPVEATISDWSSHAIVDEACFSTPSNAASPATDRAAPTERIQADIARRLRSAKGPPN